MQTMAPAQTGQAGAERRERAQAPVAWYRTSPYLLFFPVGAALSFAGVVPWVLFALGRGGWRPTLHAITEVQGALTCFAIGFLFTFVPRRTGTPPPTTLECATALGLLGPPPLMALLNHERLAHACWALLAAFLGVFVLSRIPRAIRNGVAVSQLLWLPVSFGLAVAGAGMAAAVEPGRPAWLMSGTSLVWQGLLGGLVAGIGGMLLPMLLHREPHRGDRSARSWWLHGAAAASFVASFALEWALDLRVGYAVRGLVVVAVLVPTARLWRPPREKGVHRWIAWTAAWLIPLGFLAVAAWPAHRIGLLHLTFLSGFMMLTLAVANHVSIAHGGRDPLLYVRPAPLLAMFGAIALATVARLLVTLDPTRLVLWIGVASISFVLALGAWATWVLPRLKPLPAAVDRPVGGAGR